MTTTTHQRMTARFPGVCACGRRVGRGDVIAYDRARRRVAGCLSCDMGSGGKPRHAPDRFDMQAEDDMRDACGPGL